MRRRIFIDGDPMFTQVAFVTGVGDPRRRAAPLRRPVHVRDPDRAWRTAWSPSGGRAWLPTRPVVATSLLGRAAPARRRAAPSRPSCTGPRGARSTTRARAFGHKDREFERFAELPRRVAPGDYLLAAGGPRRPPGSARGERVEAREPLSVTGSVDDYLALHRRTPGGHRRREARVRRVPVGLVQRPQHVLPRLGPAGAPPGHGVHGLAADGRRACSRSPTSSRSLDAIDRVDRDYDLHARAARRIAEEHFEARTVIARDARRGGRALRRRGRRQTCPPGTTGARPSS